MKAVLLALLCGLLLFVAASIAFKLTETGSRARLLLKVYLAVLVVLIVVHLSTPADLGFLPSALVTPIEWVDLGFAVFLFAAGFFGGVLQLYNLADRGFSLRILIDILQSSRAGLTPGEVMTDYSAGHGIPWMYQKRLDGMTAAGLVHVTNGNAVLTPKGRRIAEFFAWLQDFARVQPQQALDR
jgi:hypothetical protein